MLSAVRLEARKLTRPVNVHIRLGFVEDVSLGCYDPETVWYVSGDVDSFEYTSTAFKNAVTALLPVICQKLKDLSFAVDLYDYQEGDLYDRRWHGTPSTTLPFAAREIDLLRSSQREYHSLR